MFFVELSLLLLLGGIFSLCFLADKINAIKLTRVICNSILIFITLGYSIYDFGSFSAISNIFFWKEFFSIFFFSELNLFSIDSFSFLLILLTGFLMSECALFLSENNVYSRVLCLCLLLIYFFLVCCFSVKDIILFYIFFEALLIPMFILIGFWGSRERKIRAVYLLFFYTLISSLLFLIGIFYLYTFFNTSNFVWLSLLCSNYLTETEQYCLWFVFFVSFASKIPIFPLHIWLPEAHVEAPTIGSVLLAGILLKIGVYGLIRFNLSLFYEVSLFYSPFIYIFCLMGIVYSSLSAIRQTDVKRIIAYSSIAHMNLVVIGIFSFNVISFEGAIFQSLSHGFVSGSLFFLIGFLYLRYHTRLVYYYGGLVQFMPIFASFFLFFTLANIAMPGTSSFIGEFLLLFGLFKTSSFICFLSATSVILGGAYSLWLYNRIFFGNIKNNFLLKFFDLSIKEIFILLFPTILVLLLGIKPNYLLKLCAGVTQNYFIFVM
jgi:proton-translocating NADH-quinone oxidoreductase chain M